MPSTPPTATPTSTIITCRTRRFSEAGEQAVADLASESTPCAHRRSSETGRSSAGIGSAVVSSGIS
jgi:hypothetical protein